MPSESRSRAGSWHGGEAMPLKDGPRGGGVKKFHYRARPIGIAAGLDYRNRIDHGSMRIFGRDFGDSHLVRFSRIRRIDDACAGIAILDVGEDLPHIFGENEPSLQLIPQTERS